MIAAKLVSYKAQRILIPVLNIVALRGRCGTILPNHRHTEKSELKMKELEPVSKDQGVEEKAAKTKNKVRKENQVSFSKAALYVFKKEINLNELADALNAGARHFTKTKSENYSLNVGFVAPYTIDNDNVDYDVCHFISDRAIILKFREDSKSVPTSVLDNALEERLEELEAEDGVELSKEDKKSIRVGILSGLIERAFPKRKETWVVITPKLFVTSDVTESSIRIITKAIRETISLPILPLSVLSAKNIYNAENGNEEESEVSTTLNKLIAGDLFGDESGVLSKAYFNVKSDGGSYSITNGDESIPSLISPFLSEDIEFKKAVISNPNYSCTINGKDMRKMANLWVAHASVAGDCGDLEEEWFDGTCSIYIGAFEEHLKNMAALCSNAK